MFNALIDLLFSPFSSNSKPTNGETKYNLIGVKELAQIREDRLYKRRCMAYKEHIKEEEEEYKKDYKIFKTKKEYSVVLPQIIQWVDSYIRRSFLQSNTNPLRLAIVIPMEIKDDNDFTVIKHDSYCILPTTRYSRHIINELHKVLEYKGYTLAANEEPHYHHREILFKREMGRHDISRVHFISVKNPLR